MNETLSATSISATQPDHDAISRHAQDLWEKYGRPSGRDEEIWLEAERALKGQNPSATSAASTAPTPGSSASPVQTTPAPAKNGAPKSGPSSRATAAAKIPPLKANKNPGR